MSINNKKRGRPNSEKIWSNKIRHVFSTDITKDPDLHVLLYILGDQASNVIRQGLHDYMVATNSKAMDPDFRERLFMAANQLLVRGENSGPKNVLFQISEGGVVAPLLRPEPTPTLIKHQVEIPQDGPVIRDHDQEHLNEKPDDRPRKPAPIIDFGPDTIDDTTNTSSAPKQSQRDKWLGRHK
jgi:hypothetical protein